jgi:hypothetical protein
MDDIIGDENIVNIITNVKLSEPTYEELLSVETTMKRWGYIKVENDRVFYTHKMRQTLHDVVILVMQNLELCKKYGITAVEGLVLYELIKRHAEHDITGQDFRLLVTIARAIVACLGQEELPKLLKEYSDSKSKFEGGFRVE